MGNFGKYELDQRRNSRQKVAKETRWDRNPLRQSRIKCPSVRPSVRRVRDQRTKKLRDQRADSLCSATLSKITKNSTIRQRSEWMFLGQDLSLATGDARVGVGSPEGVGSQYFALRSSSNSSGVLGQSFLRRRERDRSANKRPPVWQRGQ